MAVANVAWLISINWPKNENVKNFVVQMKTWLQNKKVTLPSLEAVPFGSEKLIVVPHAHLSVCLEAAMHASGLGWRPKYNPPPKYSPTPQRIVAMSADIPPEVAVAALTKSLKTRRVAHLPTVVQKDMHLYSIEDYEPGILLYALSNGVVIHSMTFDVVLAEVSKGSDNERKVRYLPPPKLPTRSHSIAVQTDHMMETSSPPQRPAKRRRADDRLQRTPDAPAKQTTTGGASTMADAPPPPRQCWKCQSWGHEISSCEGEDRCRRCAGPHKSSDCERTAPLCCVNCAQPHASSSSSCPLRPRQQQKPVSRAAPASRSRRRPAPTTRRPLGSPPDISSLVHLLMLQVVERLAPPLPRRPRRQRGKRKAAS